MAEAKLSIRVEKDLKDSAAAIFEKLGLSLSSGINLYLRQVVDKAGIPFPVTLSRSEVVGEEIAFIEKRTGEIIAEEVASAMAAGKPIARYDVNLHKPYFEYPYKKRVYDIE